jgi:hypothetical protein
MSQLVSSLRQFVATWYIRTCSQAKFPAQPASEEVAGHAEQSVGQGEEGAGRIAIRASTSEGSKDPIQIRAQVLRGQRASADRSTIMGFEMADHAGEPAEQTAGAPWREADVRRAIRLAQEAGLANYRVEIAPDGTIAIVVANMPESASKPA